MDYKRYVKRTLQYLYFPGCDEKEIFMVIFDAFALKEEEIVIEFPDENKLKVTLKHGVRETGDLTFSRNCTYVYTLPENVRATNLVAYWSEGNFLVVKEKNAKKSEIDSECGKDIDEKKFKSDGNPNISPLANEKGEHAKQETPTAEASEKNSVQEKQLISSASESEEVIIQKMKSLTTSSKSSDKSVENRDSSSASSELSKKVQESKSMDHTVRAISRLVPTKFPNPFTNPAHRVERDLRLIESILKTSMEDIEKRISFANELIDKHKFKSSKSDSKQES